MSSTLNPTKIDPKATPATAPAASVVFVARADASKPEPEGKAAASAPREAAAASAAVPPVDTSFRAASTTAPAVSAAGEKDKPARSSLGRRLMRGAMGVILAAGIVGAAMLWQSHGEAVKQIVMTWAPPSVLALLSPHEAADQASAPSVVQASVVPETPAPSAPQNATDNSAAASPPPEAAQLLQSLARELANLRQDMEQMRSAIADLKASDDQMAREIAKANDKATDKALEQALRPRVSMVSPPPVQVVAMPARKPTPLAVARPGQPRPVVATSYVPRPVDSRAVAPRPQAPSAPAPMDLSAPRPPQPLREQVP